MTERDEELQMLVADWQSLVNAAEALEPSLVRNPHWIRHKSHLEARTKELGLPAVERHGEMLRQEIEEKERQRLQRLQHLRNITRISQEFGEYD